MKNKPDFLVVGAAKSGTTSLFNYLNQHPDIYIPKIKECRFFSQLPKNFNGLGAEYFANTGITDSKEYFDLFNGYENKICGDISNDYLYYFEESIKNIKKYLNDDVKIIIILRNPTDRAYSNYMHCIRDGWENLSFEQTLEDEKKRIEDNWGWSYHHVQIGMYYEQVKAYLDNFKNVRIYLFEELENKEKFLNDIYDFIGVKRVQQPEDTTRYNVSGYPRNKLINNLLIKKNIIKKITKPIISMLLSEEKINQLMLKLKKGSLQKRSMKKETRNKLNIIFKNNIEKTSELINKDLSHWTK